MVIMIIFLLLSVVLVIGTTVYLNFKKKNSVSSPKQASSLDKKEKSKNRSKKHLTNILPLKVKDNIICIGNRYSIVLKLGTIDYNMLSITEQETIEDILIQAALSIDYPVQFFSTTEYIDTSKVVSLMCQNNTKNEKVQEYKNLLIDYLQNLQENKSVSIVQNYAIISCNDFYTSAIEELNRNSLALKGNLLRAKVSCSILNEDELYNLIYRELNKNSLLDISSLKEGVKKLYVEKKQKGKRNKHI